ncbi:unnamed protein product [Adineta ricciae]|uniref:Uncharacterized protein n=1 Tax=Adineta ricciae TaxID=249248 RepID=A0A815ZNC9_ADIRI|nr:unnamed protein product [Adineta ricciae]
MDTINSEKQEESVPLTSSAANTAPNYGKDGGPTNDSLPLKQTNTTNIISIIVVFLVILAMLIVMFILVLKYADKKDITTTTTAIKTTTTMTTTTTTAITTATTTNKVTTTLKSLPPSAGVAGMSHSLWNLMVMCCGIIISMII